ncbi:MAG: substrate-binding domain-containing protein [Pirellulales bacterium]|nr:substrate-binding domain-containing protein [Pirellulales bacterium]
MKRRKEIALAFPRGAHQEVFIEGVLQYAREKNCQWSFIVAPEWSSVSLTNLTGWPGDGVIAALNTPEEARCAEKSELAIVNISGVLAESPSPRLMVDNRAIGVLGAKHLLERGFKRFAYYGIRGVRYSDDRCRGFRETIAAAGFAVDSLAVPSTFTIRGTSWLGQQRELSAWLETLEVPCGLLAVSDARARQAIEGCHDLGINVPDQIAILGVDDQQIICEHCHPRISSIARNNVLEGYQAARLLDQMMKKRKVARFERLVPPLGVVERESTATLAVTDERLKRALDYFHANIEDPVSVKEICAQVDVSRRWLEYAFRDALGESPFNYIRRRRLQHARQLLGDEPDLKIDHIARRTGYTSANQLAKAFRQEFGLSPRQYRKSLG